MKCQYCPGEDAVDMSDQKGFNPKDPPLCLPCLIFRTSYSPVVLREKARIVLNALKPNAEAQILAAMLARTHKEYWIIWDSPHPHPDCMVFDLVRQGWCPVGKVPKIRFKTAQEAFDYILALHQNP